MGIQQPFLYDAVKSDSQSAFDPKAVTRASITSRPPRPKQTGPLISFNQHPDSYLVLPYVTGNALATNGSVKAWVKWTRIFQLVLRCFEVLCAVGLLVVLVLIKGMDATTGWVMRIIPGFAILHTVYAVYHLVRKASGRTPASSAAYMLFASFCDVSIFPCYGFSALTAKTRQSNWSMLFLHQDLTPIFTTVVFYAAAIGSGMHLVSLAISLYLAVTFRKITMLPPDMNPLEDNLTSRHKRNKSSVSTATGASEKRLSTHLESKRSSGAAYENLSRPPTIPFFHTRSNSTESFSTYRSTPSRDSRLDLPSRQYQVAEHSPRSSVTSASDLKRSSGYGPSTAPKRSSYTEVSLSDKQNRRSPVRSTKSGDGWYVADSLNSRNWKLPLQKASYQPLQQQREPQKDIRVSHPNPLDANPPTPLNSHISRWDSPLSQISNNGGTGDIADDRSRFREALSDRDIFKTKKYGELKPGTPPIMIGGYSRQVSSGNDVANGSSYKALNQRGVSGKIVEEGRGGGAAGWGNRFRKASGTVVP